MLSLGVVARGTVIPRGVKLKSLTVQMTDEPVTTGIETRLWWITAMENHEYNRDGPFDEKYPVVLLGLRER